MKTPDERIREELWKRVGPELARAVALFVSKPGVKVPKGRKKDEVLHGVLMEVVKTAYLSGLDRGYDMGFRVFGDGDELAGDEPEDRE